MSSEVTGVLVVVVSLSLEIRVLTVRWLSISSDYNVTMFVNWLLVSKKYVPNNDNAF